MRPGLEQLRHHLRLRSGDVLEEAVESWTVGEATELTICPARFLPGQLERIKATAFGSHAEVVRDFAGGFTSLQPASRAFLLKDVSLLDGVLYGAKAVRHLKSRSSRWPIQRTPDLSLKGAMYESWPGNRWFGSWLLNDILTYFLVKQGQPVFTTKPLVTHVAEYEAVLGMEAVRVDHAIFEELTLFEDAGANRSRTERAAQIRRKLGGEDAVPHPGVFLLRGAAGERRVLENEQEIASRLARTRGFKVIDPLLSSLAEIRSACAGARVIAGVEGSHLVHGLMIMPPGGRAFVIQPPDRAVSVLKLVTDRQGCEFSFMVGEGTHEAFRASMDEIERTLDLP